MSEAASFGRPPFNFELEQYNYTEKLYAMPNGDILRFYPFEVGQPVDEALDELKTGVQHLKKLQQLGMKVIEPKYTSVVGHDPQGDESIIGLYTVVGELPGSEPLHELTSQPKEEVSSQIIRPLVSYYEWAIEEGKILDDILLGIGPRGHKEMYTTTDWLSQFSMEQDGSIVLHDIDPHMADLTNPAHLVSLRTSDIEFLLQNQNDMELDDETRLRLETLASRIDQRLDETLEPNRKVLLDKWRQSVK